MIYLDGHTANELSSSVIDKFVFTTKEKWQDLQAPYNCDKKLFQSISEAKEALYELVGAEEKDRLIFTSGESEASATVFYGLLLDHISESGKNHLLTSTVEGASIIGPMKRLEKMGCESGFVPVDKNGQITVEALEKAVNPRTSILAISWVNSLTGTIQPIWEIADFCKRNDILLYVQASEILAKLSFRFQDLPIDFLSFEGNRFHGPKGSGGLFVKQGIKLGPLLFGDENKNVAALLAMGEAAREALDFMTSMSIEVARLRGEFEDRLKMEIPEIQFFAKGSNRVPNTTTFAIAGIHGEALLFYLRDKNLFATLGGGEREKLENVLKAMGVSSMLAKGAISCSLTMHTSEEEIEKAVKVIKECVEKLKKVSYVTVA